MASREARRAALQHLKASRDGVEKRTEQYTVEEAPKMFDDVPEDEYREMVKERRKEGFVVGDKSLGYHDKGEESWNQKTEEFPEDNKKTPPPKSKSKSAKADTKGSSEGPVPKAFLMTTGNSKNKRPRETDKAQQSANLDDLLNKFCTEIGSADPPIKVEPEDDDAKRMRREEGGTSVATKNADGSTSPPEEKTAAQTALTTPEKSPEAGKLPFRVSTKQTNVKKEIVEEPAAPPQGLGDWIDAQSNTFGVAGAQVLSGMSNSTDSEVKPEIAPDGGLWFYILDAYEEERASPPRVQLFGKVMAQGGKNFHNCCVTVECPERHLYLLLNADSEDEDAVKEAGVKAKEEFLNLCQSKYPALKPSRFKIVQRNYAFDRPIGREHGDLPFLKVFFNSNAQAVPSDLSGESFSHVFGSNASLLERLFLSRRIMGPSWLKLAAGTFIEAQGRLSFCPVELRAGPKSIVVPKTDEEKRAHDDSQPSNVPPLSVLSLAVQTVQRNAALGHEPVMIACTFHPEMTLDATTATGQHQLRNKMQTFVGVRRFDTVPLSTAAQNLLTKYGCTLCSSETALLAKTLGKIQDLDPDIIVGHNAYGFDLDVLASRMHNLKLNFWQKMGRLRRLKERAPRPSSQGSASLWVPRNITAGRLVVDTLLAARELMGKMTSYDLPVIVDQFFKEQLKNISVDDISKYFESPQGISELAQHTLHHALCSARVMLHLQVLPLTKQLTCIGGNTWTGSLQYKRAERNEYLLMHEFHRKKFVVPDKENPFKAQKRPIADVDDAEEAEGGKGPRRGKAQYSGGLVLDPKVGLYDDFVMLLDFNSLYPSVIQEYNICFTSVDRPNAEEAARCANEQELLGQTKISDSFAQDDEGILPAVIRGLVESRKVVKGAMKTEKDEIRKAQLEIRQKALKLTANSMYGCLGFQHSRFHARPLAAMITAKGREALQATVDVVQHELQMEVVYGDTDSVFVRTNTQDHDKAMQQASQIKRLVNKKYRRLEIEIDGVFAKLLLLKKKKYAGLKVVDWVKQTFEPEFKGLDLVRRDWCNISKEVGEKVLEKIMSSPGSQQNNNSEGKEQVVNYIHELVRETAERMDNGQVPQEQYIITKSLTKMPQDYPDAKNQVHVQVALRMISQGISVTQGQEIPYIVCLPGKDAQGKSGVAERARFPLELKWDPDLAIDIAWYKSSQIHPPLVRLLEPVEGTDAARLAECLGLDSSRFAQRSSDGGAGGEDMNMDGWAATGQVDIEALLDQKRRFDGFESSLPGVPCKKCNAKVPWKELLSPTEGRNSFKGYDALFRCDCGEAFDVKKVQNVAVLHIKNALQWQAEGNVQCTDSVCGKQTKRLAIADRGRTCLHCSGQVAEVFSAQKLVLELQYLEHLCSHASGGFLGEDHRRCRQAVNFISFMVGRLLRLNKCNWVDCGQLFGDIFGPAKASMAAIAQ